MGSPEDLKMDVAGVCKWCGVKLTESPLLSCEEMKVVKWQQLIRDDLYGSTSKSVLHSLSCGELGVRTEAMTVLCSQLLPHFCADDACLASQDSFPTKIENVIKSTGRSVCDLLSQQKLDDATAELEFLHHCVNMLLQCAQSNPNLSAALGFQFCCLPCLSHLLTFCRDTERDGVLQSLSPLLASLFKTSFSLLKLCLEGTEHVTVDHTHLTHLLSMLNQLAEVALTFDPSLILLCWKFLAKFVCRTKSQLTDIMQSISPIIQQLCVAMETKSRECVMSICETGGQIFGKLLKLCRFLSTLLVKMISEFEEVALDRMLSQQLLQMVINVQAAVVRSGCRGNHWREFESNILLLREPLIQALLHSTNFINQLLDEELVGEGGHAAWALCLCTLTKLFPTLNEGVQDDIMGERTSREEDGHTCVLIDALFSALHESYVDVASGVRVGGVMCNGQPQRMVTLYEHVLSHISCLILCLPTRHRPKMEHVLVGYLFFDDAHCSMMAADAFVFLSQQAGPDATLLHTHHLCTLLSSLPGGHWQLSSVIHRLVFLLPPSHIQRLSTIFGVEQFPVVSAHLSSTGHLDASQLHQYLLQRLTTQISSQAPDLFALSTTLESLGWAVCGMESVPPTLSSLPDQLLLVLTSLPLSSQLSSEVAAMVLHLLSHLLSSSPSPLSLLPLFQALRQFLSLHPLPQPLALATPLLLKHCGQLMVPQQVQSEVLGVVAAAFNLLLSHHSWFVQTLTLEAFRNFAELTPYPAMGEKCIPKDLSSHVVNFLQKVPYGRESVDTRQIQSILRQHQRPQATPSASETTPPPTDGLGELLNAWDSVSRVRGPSPWLLNQLKQLCSQIQIYLSQHT